MHLFPKCLTNAFFHATSLEATASPSQCTTLLFQFNGGRHSRAPAGSSTPPSSLSQQRLHPTAAIRSSRLQLLDMQGCCQGSLSLFLLLLQDCSHGRLWLPSEITCPEESWKANGASPAQVPSIPPQQHIFFSISDLWAQIVMKTEREKGEEQLLNSLQEFVASLDSSYHYSIYLTSVKQNICCLVCFKSCLQH